MRILVAVSCLAALQPGCRSDPLEGAPVDLALAAAADLVAAGDLATVADGGANPCAPKSACDCIHARGCAVVESGCFCPYPMCGMGNCFCSGGFFYGCAPVSANCPKVDCGPAGQGVGPDARGCFDCGPPPTCEAARANLRRQCGFSESYIAGLRCDKNPACVLQCTRLLKRCEDVGCAFCETCDCAGHTDFSKCVFACP